MAIIKPFKGLRPPREVVEELACLPYDVMNSEEAAEMAEGKEKSLLRITKAEIECPGVEDIHSETVYNKSVENFNLFQEKGWLVQDDKPRYYIYAQTMNGRTQYGIVGAAACADYENGIIKKHELTRPDKEEDRKNHIRITNFNAEPVFFAYPDNTKIDVIVHGYTKTIPEYDFTTPDKVRHQLWIISNQVDVKNIEKIFAKEVKYTYVADGHHRTAAAAHVGEERKNNNPNHSGGEEYNFFMAVHFPASQLNIIAYNRVVTDLNGLTKEQFLEKISQNYLVTNKHNKIHKPSRIHEISMYIDGEWYALMANQNTYNDKDPIDCLDVTVLSKTILEPVLGIEDLRKSKRIDFVGGIRGLEELKQRVDSGEMSVAFALFPVSMEQLINIADTGNIMPPKTTWFEPKLRSGLVIHSLD